MEPLIASTLALAAGPLLARLFARDARLFAGLDGFIVVSLIALVGVHVLPHSVIEAGPLALFAFALGLLVPVAWERVVWRFRGENAALFGLFVVGVLAHGLLDGTSLHAHGDVGEDTGLSAVALGVVLHRLPVGVALATLVRPLFGGRRTVALALTYLLSTTIGSLEAVHEVVERVGLALGALNALIGGSLLHGIALHGPRARGPMPPSVRRAEGVGGALALVAAALFTRAQGGEAGLGGVELDDALARLVSVSAAPMLAALFVSGAVAAIAGPALRFVTTRRVDDDAPAGSAWDAVKGALMGIAYPLCSCSVDALWRTIVRGPLSSTGAIAFLVAAPTFGAPALVLTIALTDGGFVAARAIGVLIFAVAVGAITGRQLGARGRAGDERGAPCAHSVDARAVVRFRAGVLEAVDHTGPWLLFGITVAALAMSLLPTAPFSSLPRALEIFLWAVAGAPLTMCAAGLTPVLAVLAAKGVSTGGLVALALAGPSLHVATGRLVIERHGRRVAFALVATVVVFAWGIGVVADRAFPSTGSVLALGAPFSAGATTIASIVVVALAAIALIRQGVRGVLGQLVGLHDHVHDDEGHCVSEPAPPVVVRGPFARASHRPAPRAVIHLPGTWSTSSSSRGDTPEVALDGARTRTR